MTFLEIIRQTETCFICLGNVNQLTNLRNIEFASSCIVDFLATSPWTYINCKFGNVRENFIFANSVKWHICGSKFATRAWFIYIYKRQSDFAILQGFYFHGTLHISQNKTLAKISKLTVCWTSVSHVVTFNKIFKRHLLSCWPTVRVYIHTCLKYLWPLTREPKSSFRQ